MLGTHLSRGFAVDEPSKLMTQGGKLKMIFCLRIRSLSVRQHAQGPKGAKMLPGRLRRLWAHQPLLDIC